MVPPPPTSSEEDHIMGNAHELRPTPTPPRYLFIICTGLNGIQEWHEEPDMTMFNEGTISAYEPVLRHKDVVDNTMLRVW